jgi:hypothetical protein
MALLLSDGFDWISATADITQQWRSTNGTNITLNSTGNPWGGKCIQMTDSAPNSAGMDGIFEELYQPISGSVIRVFFRIKTSASFAGSGVAGTVGSNFPSGGESLWKLQTLYESTSGAPCLSAGLNSSGFIVVMRGEDATSNARTAAAIGAVAVNDANWHSVEFEITIGATGSVKVWIDGTLDINSTSIDTDDFNAARGLSSLYLFGLGMGKNDATSSEFVYYDDVIVWDDSGTDFTGSFGSDVPRIETRIPNNAGDTTQFTASAGSNYQCVDDPLSAAADDDSTYVESTTSGHIDLYNYQNYTIYPSSIKGVKVATKARITTDGRAQMRVKAKAGGTSGNGSTHEVWATTYAYHYAVFGKQPDATAWNLIDLDGAQFGFERL